MVLFPLAAVRGNATLNYVGLGVYWALDVLDGFLARRLNQETRIGAQMDILGDRMQVSFFYLNYLYMHPQAVVPVSLFLVQFMGIDHYLSNQFMRWPILSPNYFHRVDPRIWKLNWSPLAKGLNTGLVTCLLIAGTPLWIPTLASIILIGVKGYSALRILRLSPPEEQWRLSQQA